MQATTVTNVASSNVYAYSYFPEEKVLEVTFNSGSIYIYIDVPPSIFDALQDAPSVGRFLHTSVKPFYSYAQVF